MEKFAQENEALRNGGVKKVHALRGWAAISVAHGGAGAGCVYVFRRGKAVLARAGSGGSIQLVGDSGLHAGDQTVALAGVDSKGLKNSDSEDSSEPQVQLKYSRGTLALPTLIGGRLGEFAQGLGKVAMRDAEG